MKMNCRVIIALLLTILLSAYALPAVAGSLTIDPVNQKFNGAVRNIGKIDANLNGNTMDATFTLNKANANLTNCCEFQWLQVVTSLVADAGNPTYKNAALKIPVIDTPNGGYDGQVGEDDLPWYLTAADIANNMLNGTNADGSKFFKTNDTPSVKGAAFDTWLVAKTAAKTFCVISGFEWGSGTLGGMATLKKKNGDGVPIDADITTITNALTNGGFVGWTPMRDCDITCVPEPATWRLIVVAAIGATVMARRRKPN
jgi:hypothetical protein